MLTRSQFINTYAGAAQRVYNKYGIFPQTVLTLAIVESQGKGPDGNFYPGQNASSKKANNYFGIKKGVNWSGPTIKLSTPGDADKISTFRKYASVEESFEDFGRFLSVNPRYRAAGVFDAPDFITQMNRIAKAGYAENPNYATLLNSVANTVNNTIKEIKEITKKPPVILIFVALGAYLLYSLNTQKNASKIY
jgi:flagellar protein FlgJ